MKMHVVDLFYRFAHVRNQRKTAFHTVVSFESDYNFYNKCICSSDVKTIYWLVLLSLLLSLSLLLLLLLLLLNPYQILGQAPERKTQFSESVSPFLQL